MMFPTGRTQTAPPAKILVWLLLAIAAGTVAYFVFRGYLSPELMLHFSNAFTC